MNFNYSKEEEFLIRNDKNLSKVIKTNGHINFSNKKTDPFDALVGIIISQFISTHAANSIKRKILQKFNEKNFKIKNFPQLKINYQVNKDIQKIFEIPLWKKLKNKIIKFLM